MTYHKGRAALAVCGAVAVLAFPVGYSADDSQATTAAWSTATVMPAPPPTPGDRGGGALPVQPVGGGGCYIGLNCGCIPRITCPTPHRRPPPAVGARDDPAGKPNP